MAVTFLGKIKLKALLTYRDVHNALWARRPQTAGYPGNLPELAEIMAHGARRTDFSDHLVTIFTEGMSCRPRLIVELGTRGGESTFVFERVARLCQSALLSVDIEDCLQASAYPAWNFVKSDDVAFAGKFQAWCKQKHLEPGIDLLFIDTSHLYEHTVAEIKAWLPHVAPTGKVIFHDTNMQYFYCRADKSLDIGWDNQRGVIRAVEEYFNCRWDETKPFVDARGGWLIRHWPNCSGLTVLDRLPGK
jgi:predicted O-methyltransferase YrrM